jgi:hypothetical protein
LSIKLGLTVAVSIAQAGGAVKRDGMCHATRTIAGKCPYAILRILV